MFISIMSIQSRIIDLYILFIQVEINIYTTYVPTFSSAQIIVEVVIDLDPLPLNSKATSIVYRFSKIVLLLQVLEIAHFPFLSFAYWEIKLL